MAERSVASGGYHNLEVAPDWTVGTQVAPCWASEVAGTNSPDHSRIWMVYSGVAVVMTPEVEGTVRTGASHLPATTHVHTSPYF